jgi:hypothetical protein
MAGNSDKQTGGVMWFEFRCDYCGKISSVCNMDEHGHKFCSSQCMHNYDERKNDTSFRNALSNIAYSLREQSLKNSCKDNESKQTDNEK